MKKALFLLFLILFLLLVPSIAFGEENNNIVNGDFENLEDIYLDWDTYIDDIENSDTTLEFVNIDNNVVLRLESDAPNYLSISQSIFLKANTNYEIGAKIKAENIDSNNVGGYIRLEEDQGESLEISGTISQWQDIKFYVTTLGTDIYTSIEIGIGDFNSYNKGVFIVDDVYIKENVKAQNNEGLTLINPDENIEATQMPTTQTKSVSPIFTNREKLSIICLLFCLMIFMMAVTWYSSKARALYSVEKLSKRLTNFYLIIGIFIIVFFKYVVASFGTDLSSDIGAFINWSNSITDNGIRYFYQNSNSNYPCGYMYVLYLVGLVGKGLNLATSSLTFNLILKTPVIIAEILTMLLAYKISKKYLGDKNSLIFAFLIFLNPAVLINTSAWGQIDAVFTLSIIFVFYLLENKKYYFGAAAFAVAMLIKTQAILFLPVVGAFYIGLFLREEKIKKNLLDFFISLLILIATYLVIAFPFRGDSGVFWILKNVTSSAGTYNYASMNAFNFYTLFGGNYAKYSDSFLFLNYQIWGYIFIGLTSLASMFLYFLNSKKKALFLIIGLMIAGVFTFGHGMHERYIMPLPILLFFAYIYFKDRRIINAAILYTIFALFSQLAVLYLFGESFYNTIVSFMSMLSLICFGYLAYVVYVLLVRRGTIIQGLEKSRPVELKRKNDEKAKKLLKKINKQPAINLHKKYDKPTLNKSDRILMISMTVIYAIIAFINLGSFSVPKNSWSPEEKNESVIIELNDVSKIMEIKYYFGLGQTDIVVTSSTDGIVFEDIILPESEVDGLTIEHKAAKMYRWNFIDTDFDAKFIKMTFSDDNIDVKEIGLVGNNSVLSVKNIFSDIEYSKSDIKNIVDEQKLIPDVISYKQGMYFDEIYHARTALEHIEKLSPYEITHPPLGKSLLAIGIRIFGMNPFGWRFMGTLFGIMMLPLMYIFAKRLLRRTTFAFIATFLLMFDFMHFAQARMATIDSYAIFFIILMFLFMFEYFKMNFNKDKLYKTFIPLGLSGIAFGLGSATKWLCLYSGVGLAIIFFYIMIKRFREYYAAKLLMNEEGCRHVELYRRVVKSYYYKLIMTLVFCIIAFIVIPALIYYLSYIPYMRVENNPYDFKMILENQKYMFNYHSTLDTSAHPHPFASRWSTWILNIRPVYLFQGKGYPANMISSLSTFGNPIIWWGFIPGLIIILIAKFYEKNFEGALGFIAVAGLAEFIPWIFISRETYIYHYFASIPFVILIITMACKFIWERFKFGKYFVLAFMLASVIMFIMFYPMITGVPVLRSYAESLRWLETWPFY